jgi:8-oxo-dGTP pyrophosphatase MutT (NUDIX family)
VFPGGAVDPADSDDSVTKRVIGLDDGQASAGLGLATGGLRVWIAALREAFEEAGLLLARPAAGAGSAPGGGLTGSLADGRTRLNAGEVSLVDLLAEHRLVLDTSGVFLFSHWLTPEGAPRRYDTWFLVAAAPHGQEGSHDDAELVHSEWVRPSDALDRHARGDLDLIFPTLRTLCVLESFANATALVDAVRDANGTRDQPPLVVPDASGERVALPGDDLAAATRGWRGLTSRADLDAAAFLAEPGLAGRRGVA